MKASNLEWRMYGFVPYNISDIQKGIQFGHAVVEYANEHTRTYGYKKWSKIDKTFIILNGGTTNNSHSLKNDGLPKGSLNQIELKLLAAVPEMPVARFEEPDLGDQLTAICFLVDERVWNRERYPDFEFDPTKIGYEGWVLDQPRQFYDWKMQFSASETGADHIVWLRDFLKGFKLA